MDFCQLFDSKVYIAFYVLAFFTDIGVDQLAIKPRILKLMGFYLFLLFYFFPFPVTQIFALKGGTQLKKDEFKSLVYLRRPDSFALKCTGTIIHELFIATDPECEGKGEPEVVVIGSEGSMEQTSKTHSQRIKITSIFKIHLPETSDNTTSAENGIALLRLNRTIDFQKASKALLTGSKTKSTPRSIGEFVTLVGWKVDEQRRPTTRTSVQLTIVDPKECNFGKNDETLKCFEAKSASGFAIEDFDTGAPIFGPTRLKGVLAKRKYSSSNLGAYHDIGFFTSRIKKVTKMTMDVRSGSYYELCGSFRTMLGAFAIAICFGNLYS